MKKVYRIKVEWIRNKLIFDVENLIAWLNLKFKHLKFTLLK